MTELAPSVGQVDAVDFSAAMVAAGKQRPGGDRPNLRWQVSVVEVIQRHSRKQDHDPKYPGRLAN